MSAINNEGSNWDNETEEVGNKAEMEKVLNKMLDTVVTDKNETEQVEIKSSSNENEAEINPSNDNEIEDAQVKSANNENGSEEAVIDPCNDNETEEVQEATSTNENESEDVDPEGWLDLLGSGRIRKRTLEKGQRSKGRPQTSSKVKIRYQISFEDEIVKPDEEIEFNLNESEVLQVLDLVVAIMYLDEMAEVTTDPDFAYGKLGLPEKNIPPNAAVHIKLKLLEFSPPVVITDLTIAERVANGTRKNDRGYFWFLREEYRFAIQCYRKAGEYFDDEQIELDAPVDRFSLPEDLQNLLDKRSRAFNNLTLCQMRIEAFDLALSSVKQVLKIEPNNEKALYRKAKILEGKGLLDEAMGIFLRIVRLYPNNKAAKSDLERLNLKKRKNKLQEQQMSKRMLGLDKPVQKKKKESFLGSTTGIFVSSLGVLSVAMAVAAYKLKWL